MSGKVLQRINVCSSPKVYYSWRNLKEPFRLKQSKRSWGLKPFLLCHFTYLSLCIYMQAVSSHAAYMNSVHWMASGQGLTRSVKQPSQRHKKMKIISSRSQNGRLHPFWYSCHIKQEWSYKSLHMVQLIKSVLVLCPQQWDLVTTWTSEHWCPKHKSCITKYNYKNKLRYSVSLRCMEEPTKVLVFP